MVLSPANCPRPTGSAPNSSRSPARRFPSSIPQNRLALVTFYSSEEQDREFSTACYLEARPETLDRFFESLRQYAATP